MNRYQKFYREVICPDLILKSNYKNVLELPKMQKIVLNSTSNKYLNDRKQIISTLIAFELISSQKAKLTYAKKSLASFKIRKGQLIGCKITLRRNRLYTFIDTLTTLVLPKFRDFAGFNKKTIDTNNLSFGFKNLMPFPQIEPHFDFFETTKGLNINLVLNTKKMKTPNLLYSAFKLPEKKG